MFNFGQCEGNVNAKLGHMNLLLSSIEETLASVRGISIGTRWTIDRVVCAGQPRGWMPFSNAKGYWKTENQWWVRQHLFGKSNLFSYESEAAVWFHKSAIDTLECVYVVFGFIGIENSYWSWWNRRVIIFKDLFCNNIFWTRVRLSTGVSPQKHDKILNF